MIKTTRKGVNYADNLLDPYLGFNEDGTWSATAGTGSGTHSDTFVFFGDKSLKLQNTVPTTDLTVTNSIQNTVINLKGSSAYLSFYVYSQSNADDLSGSVEVFVNAISVGSQSWSLLSTEFGEWYRFVSDQPYTLSLADVVTFKFTFDGDAGYVGTKTVFIDGMMLNDTARVDNGVAVPLFTAPRIIRPFLTTVGASSSVNAFDRQAILCDASGGVMTITLPKASQNKDAQIWVNKIDATGNIVTIDGNGAETINGSATQSLSIQYESVTVICDGVEWWII